MRRTLEPAVVSPECRLASVIRPFGPIEPPGSVRLQNVTWDVNGVPPFTDSLATVAAARWNVTVFALTHANSPYHPAGMLGEPG